MILFGIIFIVCFIYYMCKESIRIEQESRKKLKIIIEGEENLEEDTTNTETSIVIKDPYFDVSKIKEYKSEKAEKILFRPDNLSQYIGQENAKETIRTAVKIITTIRPIHLLINGWAGCGKTTLLNILTKMLNAKLIYRIANEISEPDQIINLINEINSSNQLTVLFIDELHSLKANLAECFYPILEDFKIAGKQIKPFVFVGATTDKDELVKKMNPLLDRIQIQITLDKYNDEELVTIIKQYKDQLYPEFIVNEDNYKIIAKNSRGTPRRALSLLLKNLVVPNVKKVLKESNIIYEGLTDKDINILKLLVKNSKPIGADALAQMVSVNRSDYATIYEPYLTEKGYLLRTNRGRIIGEEGKKILETILKESL